MSDTGQTTTKIPELKPYAVDIPDARKLMGNKSRSGVYEAAARGEVDLIKDGNKTLVVLASIERRQEALPPTKVKLTPRKRGR